jgi:hypothetical protein
MTNREVEQLNLELLCEYETTTIKLLGYRLWFRGYLPSQDNDLLVGFWLAWPDIPLAERLTYFPSMWMRYFVSLCGIDYAGEYKKGGEISNWDKVSTNHSSTLQDLVDEHDKALVRLKKYLNTHVTA